MPGIIINISDAEAAVLEAAGVEVETWLLREVQEAVRDFRGRAARERIPELLKNQDFVDEVLPIVHKYMEDRR